MMKAKTTKRALLMSVLALVLCVSMLIGSTFAWFTDTVTSGNNKIVAGNLDVELEYSKDTVTWKTVSAATDLFTGALWEPGHTEVVYLKLINKGTLALNYQLGINIASETEGTNVNDKTFKLSDYIEFGVVENQSTKFATRADAIDAVTDSKKLNEGYVKASSMVPGASDIYMALVVYMPETVGNEANYKYGTDIPTINLGINLVATQKTHESDSFDDQYDVLAQGGYVTDAAPTSGTKEYTIYSGNTNVKAATMLIDAESVADTDLPIEISVVPAALNSNVTVTEEQEAATYEITVKNLKEGNTTPIKVELNVGTGLTGVEVYHNEALIDSVYNPTTGYVVFETTSFSPYTVVFDAVAEEQPTESEGNNLPVANVVNSPEYENVDLPWGSYGAWSPTAGLDSQLEAAYTFACEDTAAEAKASAYANWYCDFYVKLDKDLGENQIFLGGNYGAFGWVGFHNGDLTLEANTEIPLLGSVTSNPWTYAQVAESVGTFICGVGDVDDALVGATFTVMLRLTNPEDETEFYNVSTINHTFVDNKIYTADALQTAVNAGGTVKLGADINMNGAAVTIPENGNVVLDLNGYTLTSMDGGKNNNWAINVDNGASLTLNDSVGTGKIVASCYGVYVQPGATFTMNGGTIHVSGNGVYDMGVVVWNGKFVMNAGTIEGLYAVYASDYWKNQGTTDKNCEITIAEGCTLTGTYSQVDIYDAPTAVVDVPDSISVTTNEE